MQVLHWIFNKVYVCIHAHVCTCMYMYVYVYVCMYACTYVCVCVYVGRYAFLGHVHISGKDCCSSEKESMRILPFAFQRHLEAGKGVICCLLAIRFNPLNALCCNTCSCMVVAAWPHSPKGILPAMVTACIHPWLLPLQLKGEKLGVVKTRLNHVVLPTPNLTWERDPPSHLWGCVLCVGWPIRFHELPYPQKHREEEVTLVVVYQCRINIYHSAQKHLQ